MLFSRVPAYTCAAAAFIAVAGADCDNVGNFDGGVLPDAGTTTGGPDPAEVGKPCVYDPNDADHLNPTNQCANGLDCLINTRDHLYDSGLGLANWEDQFTIYEESPQADVGYCTVKGSLLDPSFVCPNGLAAKILSPNIVVCLRTCGEPGDCLRNGDTCDVRYFDVVDGQQNDLPTCVRRCEFDIHDCVRSGITVDPQNPAVRFPALVEDDLRGGAECNVDTGICNPEVTHTNALPGAPCAKTSECGVGATCFQAPIMNAVLGEGAAVSEGFCASPCTPRPGDPNDPNQQSNCTDGFVCQAVRALDLGFIDEAAGVPGPITLNLATGALSTVGGYCFHQCAEGVQGSCDVVTGTTCASLDEGRALDTWNTVPQCLPEGLAL